LQYITYYSIFFRYTLQIPNILYDFTIPGYQDIKYAVKATCVFHTHTHSLPAFT